MKYRWLWGIVLLLAAGDIATTLYGLEAGASEGNPVVDESMQEHGELEALMALKIAAIVLALALQRVLPVAEWVIPLGLATPWGLAVGINLIVIASII